MRITNKNLLNGLSILILALILQACAHHHHGTETTSDNAVSKLTLDNGKKWHMDSHTRKTLASMKGKVNALDADTATIDARKSLGAALNQDLETLISGCTMEGDAHNALHEFLVPFMPVVQQLEKTGDQQALQQSQAMLNGYANFFH
ncbi:MAG: hypothetical protein H7A01_01345 [Hahellaceae bacterium]|jgi:hypothetical protein|nr:hypothetical protein [Hahellaceae bacterium]